MANIEQTLKTTRTDPKRSLAWLYSWVGGKLRSGKIPEEAFTPRSLTAFIGGMFIYEYDPKTKDTLPWWDTLPVVIPVEMYDDGWLGLNLHYIPPMLRAKLLDKLLQFHQNAHTTRAYMKVSYQFLSEVVKTEMFSPCVKRYLISHLRSPLLKISDMYWEKVAMLPIQQFHGASSQMVWNNPSGQKRRK